MAGRKGKNAKSKQAKEPVVVKGNITVRDCLTWRQQEGYAPEGRETPGQGGHYLPTKADLGRAKSRGYNMPPTGAHKGAHDEDGRVIEALRGWPNSRYEQEYMEDMAAREQNGGGGDGGGGNRKGDAPMGALISHYYLQEAIRKKQAEEEAEARKAAAKATKAHPGKGDIRENRTSQLRAIAGAVKVDKDAKELWQMPKFKNNARSHLSTTTKKSQNKGERARNGSASGVDRCDVTGNGDPCTCYDNNPGMYDGGRPDSNTQNYHYDGPVNNTMDDYNFGDENDDNKLFAV